MFGGSNLVFGAVGGPAFVSDLDRGRRAGNFADFDDYVRLIGALDVIHQEGGGPLEPNDLPVETRHLDMYRTFAIELDKTWQCLGLRGDGRSTTRSRSPRLIRGVDRDTLVREPSLMTVINTNSPLRLDGPMGDGLIEMALHGQPVVATPFTLAGAMSPVSLAGRARPAERRGAVPGRARPDRPAGRADGLRRVHLERGHADRRAGVRDARVGQGRDRQRPAGASLRAARGARRTRPPRTSSTPRPRTSPRWPCGARIMGGVNLLYQGAGWLEGGLTASYEKLIIDAEILQMMSEVLQPLAGRRRRASASTRSPRSGRAATSSAPRTRSSATRRRSTGRSCPTGATSRPGRRTAPETATERANAIWKRLLAEAVPPPLDPAVAEALDAFVARRKREIERGR